MLVICKLEYRKVCKASKCRVYSTVNHPWWVRMFSTDGVCCGWARLHAYVTFGGSGGMMTTATTELLYPYVSQAKSQAKASRRGK